jgi:hypothetical protein
MNDFKKDGKYEIYFEKRNDDAYEVLGWCPDDDCFVFVETMNREELKNFRNMIHNLLLDLNLELNYE